MSRHRQDSLRDTFVDVRMWDRKADMARMAVMKWAAGKVRALPIPWLRLAGWLTVFVCWWEWTGLVAGLLLTGVSYGAWRWAWLRWRRAAAGGRGAGPGDYRDERRDRAILQEQWPRACDEYGITDKRTRETPTLDGLRMVHPGTFTATIDMAAIGHAVEDLETRAAKIASACRCHEVIVKRGEPGIAKVTFHRRDAIGRVLPLADLPAPASGRLTYGIHSDGAPASVELDESLLTVGVTGSGKSTVAQALVLDAIRQRIPIRLYIADPKRQEFADYAEHLGQVNGTIEVRRYEPTVDGAEKMFKSVLGALEKRQEVLAQQKIRKWTPKLAMERPDEFPLVIVLVDDMLRFTETLKAGTGSPLAQIVTLGRAAGFRVNAISQVGQKQEIGALKAVIPNVVCMRTRSRVDTDVVLGDQATAAGAECHRLTEPGVGYSYQDGDFRARKFRAAYVTDEDVRYIAAGQLPPAVRAAMAEQEQRGVEQKATKSGATMLYRYWFTQPEWWAENFPALMARFGWHDGPPTDRPAYIGISIDAIRRAAQHDDDLRAFTKGPHRFETEVHPDRKTALKAEKAAIEAERPTFNQQLNSRNPLRRIDKIETVIVPLGGRDITVRRPRRKSKAAA